MIPQEAAAVFFPHATITALVPVSGGNINATWRLSLEDGRCVVLQRLPQAVFPNPALIMANLALANTHLHRTCPSSPPWWPCPLPTPNGRDYLKEANGDLWRVLAWIGPARCHERIGSPEQAWNIGHMLGRLHRCLSTLEPASITPPIPDFHTMSVYLRHYDQILTTTPSLTPPEQECARLIATRRSKATMLEQQQASLRIQVIHGDPKVANFLFHRENDRVMGIIDFDTLMTGLLLHDLGDCLRSCCNRKGEEEEQPTFAVELFQQVMAGYMVASAQLLPALDRQLVVQAVWTLTLELGIRFFTDHLAGNVYFKTSFPDHNLRRARNQLKLLRSIEAQWVALTDQVACLVGPPKGPTRTRHVNSPAVPQRPGPPDGQYS